MTSWSATRRPPRTTGTRGLQAFFRWVVEEELIEASPMARMRPPRVPEQPPAILREPELRALLHVVDTDRTFAGRGLAENGVGRLIEGLLRADLVIVNDLGFAPLDDVGAQLLSASWPRRMSAARSALHASHWPFESWGRFLPEHTTAVALRDRLLHHGVGRRHQR